MENKDTFKMTYSAEQQEEINQIRKKYVPQEDKMEQLRALDAKADKKATMTAIIVGVAGALIMGLGMSLIMTDFGNALGAYGFGIGIVLGIIGIALLALVYPLYMHILKKTREAIAPEIIRLTDELLK